MKERLVTTEQIFKVEVEVLQLELAIRMEHLQMKDFNKLQFGLLKRDKFIYFENKNDIE